MVLKANKRDGRYKIQPNQHSSIVERYNNGETVLTIAAGYKVSPQAIYNILDKYR